MCHFMGFYLIDQGFKLIEKEVIYLTVILMLKPYGPYFS